MFMRRRRTESFLARLAAALFLGSLVEFLAAIPRLELVKRKESCTCATFTFFSMMLSCTVGFIVLGPMILLILFSRRTRAASRGFCPVCGFAMHAAGNPEKCPACGSGWKPTPLAAS